MSGTTHHLADNIHTQDVAASSLVMRLGGREKATGGAREGETAASTRDLTRSLLRRQTMPQVNKEKGEGREADTTEKVSCCLLLSSVRSPIK